MGQLLKSRRNRTTDTYCNKKKLFVVSIIIAVLLISACSNETTTEEIEESVSLPVEVAEVTYGHLEQALTLTGTVMPNQQTPVMSMLTGKATAVHVGNGDFVDEGDILVQLDAQDMNLQLEQAQAALQAANAQLKQAKNMRDHNIWQAEQQLDQAKDLYEHAQEQEELTEELSEELRDLLKQLEQLGNLSQTLNQEQAKQAVKQAEKALEQARKTDSIEAAEAGVRQAEVGVQMAQRQVESATIEAPVSGQIVEVNVEVGLMVSPQMPILTIIDMDKAIVKVSVSEGQLISVAEGDEVTVYIPALGEQVTGAISYISPIPGEQSRKYPMEVELTDFPQKLRAGMNAQVLLSLSEEDKQLIIPIDSFIQQGDDFYVYVVNGSTVEQRQITIADENESFAVISEGLQYGEQIVVRGQFRLYDGATITIVDNDNEDVNSSSNTDGTDNSNEMTDTEEREDGGYGEEDTNQHIDEADDSEHSEDEEASIHHWGLM